MGCGRNRLWGGGGGGSGRCTKGGYGGGGKRRGSIGGRGLLEELVGDGVDFGVVLEAVGEVDRAGGLVDDELMFCGI